MPAESLYQPLNVCPSLVGSVVGAVAFSPSITFCVNVPIPPFASKVTTYVSLSEKTGTRCLSSVILTGFPFVICISVPSITQYANFCPFGISSSFGTGSSGYTPSYVASLVTPSRSLNVRVYVFAVYFAVTSRVLVTVISLVTLHTPV